MSRDTKRRIVFFRSRFFCQSPVSSPQSILCIYAKFLSLLRSILDDRIERIGVEKGREKQSSGDTRFPVSLGGEPCSESKEISVSRDRTSRFRTKVKHRKYIQGGSQCSHRRADRHKRPS